MMMTMKNKLAIHRQIEERNQEAFDIAAMWDRCTAAEVRQMIQEKDRAMEWDEHLGFLIQLLNRKLHHAEFGI